MTALVGLSYLIIHLSDRQKLKSRKGKEDLRCTISGFRVSWHQLQIWMEKKIHNQPQQLIGPVPT